MIPRLVVTDSGNPDLNTKKIPGWNVIPATHELCLQHPLAGLLGSGRGNCENRLAVSRR